MPHVLQRVPCLLGCFLCADWYYVALLDGSKSVLAEVGSKVTQFTVTSSNDPISIFHTLRATSPAFVRIYLSGDDGEYWLGHYGTTFRDISVCTEGFTWAIQPSPPPPV